MNSFLAISLFAALSTTDLEQLGKYDNVQAQRSSQAMDEARRAFAGRGREIAEHFLKHGDYPPSGGAYAFVLKALGDAEATILLIGALPDPPKFETGVTAKYGMGRDPGEIRFVIEDTLEANQRVRTDERVISALIEAAEIAKKRPQGIGLGNAGAAVSLLGKCRGPKVVEALQTFASDPEPSIRTSAVEALGEIGVKGKGIQPFMIQTLARTLQSDSDVHARLQAAASLGNLGSPDAAEPLRSALGKEKDPQVIDAIVTALERLKEPILEPKTCREIVERCWEANACAPLFECWRASVSREAIIDAASSSTPVLRALALRSLTWVPAPARKWAILGPEPAPPPVAFDSPTRDRLLSSVVELLSNETAAFPKDRKISFSTAQMTKDALWEISGRNIPVALQYADRITPVAWRYTGSGRYGASDDLYRKDPNGYLSYRQPRQLLAAILLALPLSLLIISTKIRRGATLLALSVLAWGASSLLMSGVRELPPPPLQFLTVSFIAFFAAGIASAIQTWIPWRPLRGWGNVPLALMAAGALAFLACGWSRWNHFFPIGGEGWELIFDPLGSALLAAGLAFLFSLPETLITKLGSSTRQNQP